MYRCSRLFYELIAQSRKLFWVQTRTMAPKAAMGNVQALIKLFRQILYRDRRTDRLTDRLTDRAYAEHDVCNVFKRHIGILRNYG